MLLGTKALNLGPIPVKSGFMKTTTKIIAAALIVGLFVYGAARLSTTNTSNETVLKRKIIEVPNGYGYQIFSGDKLLVQQEFIPAVSGNIPFNSAKDAKKVADLVIDKIQNRTSPQISLEELNELDIELLDIP